MSTQKVKPDPEALEQQHTHQRGRSFGRRVGAFVVVAALGLVACSGPGDTPRVENATTARPAEAPETRAEKVATRFLEAYGAFDPKQAITYLADDADLSGLIATVSAEGIRGTASDLRLLISWLEAQGYVQRLGSCEGTGHLASGTGVRCTFDFHALRSDEIGLGPYSGSYFDLTVRDGRIVQASVTWELGEFSAQMWEPVADWVSTTYPEDAAVMYTDGTRSQARATQESIQLWKRRTREYVATETVQMVAIAERFMEARNAYDAETAMSLVADDGATALMMDDNVMLPNMPTVRLDRDELALALEAERLYKVRYGSFECRPDPVGWAETQITCSYLMDNRLRQIEGFPPKESSFGIGVRNDRITNLSFPWLNVGFPSEVPTEGARFVKWLQAEHPEAGGPFDRGELFRTAGQEVTLILTPESLDLLAGYLQEYERSVSG